MPWRAPGTAGVADPCGVAGGDQHGVKQTAGGEYYPTKNAKLGDLGSKVHLSLPPPLLFSLFLSLSLSSPLALSLSLALSLCLCAFLAHIQYMCVSVSVPVSVCRCPCDSYRF